MIKVISQSTAEREAETKALYEQCRPYLEKGYSLRQAVLKATGKDAQNPHSGWFRALIDYAKTQGHDYHANRWMRGDE